MTSSYAILATVTLQHDYYADGASQDFEILPSADTAAALKGAGLLTKAVGNVLVILSKLDDTGATYIELPAGLKLRFYLQLSNPAFLNITNVPGAPGKALYFSNLHANSDGGTRYLNRAVPTHNNGNAYAIGDMVSSGGLAHEAIKPVSPGGQAPGNTAFWHARAGAQYVHSGDLMRLSDGRLRLETAPDTEFAITIFRLNAATLAFDEPAAPEQLLTFTAAQEAITIDLTALPTGRYRLVVNGAEHEVYIDASASYARVFGVIELYNLFGAAHEFGWRDAAGVPKGLDHAIRFANRLAIWKYITRTTQVTGIEMNAVPNAFVPGPQPREFQSVFPLPLKQQPIKTLQLMKGATILASKLANPPPERLSTCTAGGNTYFCAEMYLNY